VFLSEGWAGKKDYGKQTETRNLLHGKPPIRRAPHRRGSSSPLIVVAIMARYIASGQEKSKDDQMITGWQRSWSVTCRSSTAIYSADSRAQERDEAAAAPFAEQVCQALCLPLSSPTGERGKREIDTVANGMVSTMPLLNRIK